MMTLVSFTPFQPSPGLAFWSVVIFLLFWVMMYRFAFGPIVESLRKRDGDIQDALDQAKKAKEEMSALQSQNEALLNEARTERANMLKEAKDAGAKILAEAKEKAQDEAKRIVSSAKVEIENQKKAALTEVKNTVGNMALDIAEQVLRKELKADNDQVSFVNKLVDDIKLN